MTSPEQLDFLDPLKVNLASFEGPLELLLELVRKKKMDLQEIPLAEICEPYLEYINLMEEFDMEIAIEFLEIASTLVLIKSRSLLPKAPVEEEGEEGLDPEEELRRRLLEYQQYKAAAEKLSSGNLLGRDCFSRPDIPDDDEEKKEKEPELIFEELSVYTLVKAYKRALGRRRYHKPHQIEKEELPIEQRILEFMHRLQPGEVHIFQHLLPADPAKPEVVVSFMAVLELAKLLLVKLHQMQEFGPLHCEPATHIKEQIPFYENLWAKPQAS